MLLAIRSQTPPPSGLSTPGIASPTLSVDQCSSGPPGPCSGSLVSLLSISTVTPVPPSGDHLPHALNTVYGQSLRGLVGAAVLDYASPNDVNDRSRSPRRWPGDSEAEAVVCLGGAARR